MSMAVSLEAREPLLDHRLLEFAASVPTSLKLKRRPSQISAAPCARPPRPAIDPRARQARVRGADRRMAARAAGADGGRAARATAGCAIAASSTTARSPASGPSTASGRADHRHRLWQLIMLELWFRQFVDRAAARRGARLRRGHLAMCGIAGIVAADRLHRRARSRTSARACATSSPTAAPTKRDCIAMRQAGLAHRRLSIVDLASGQQPLANEDEQRLDRLQRRDLQPRGDPADCSRRRGHRYRTRCDTETIVHAYEQWGDALRRAVPRHVRVRDLGHAAAAPAAGPRPAGHQAALLDDRRRSAAVRLGDQGDPGERSGRRARRTKRRSPSS